MLFAFLSLPLLASAQIVDMLLPLWLSIKLATVTTLCLLFLATPLSYWLAKKSQSKLLAQFKILVLGLVSLPLVLPPTVIGFYLLLLFSPNYVVGRWFVNHGVGSLAFSFEGLVIASVIYSLPFFVQPVYAQFVRTPQSVYDAARLLEPQAWRRFMRVALPQARIGIILGALISFAHTIGEFGVVLMIGGSIAGETKVVSIAIYEQVEALNYEVAHTMSLILVLLSVVMVAVIASFNQHNK
ncbi:molybdate ABC transporter permease subunit [Psychrobacter sp. I-STPA10]|uniref:molybdate ABC transporter permease subunit n=1 Tax=Psychrobacter sp. I-STPA10 TaxID=2585769 RepID=UPI001E388D8D|nr:molybdate ABC transporter permease subunit [Psychrobacter sp. I-STPA10]